MQADPSTLLRDAGEKLFRELSSDLGCGHVDPRNPRNETCPYCRAKARVMDQWDDALVAANALKATRPQGDT